MKNLYDTQIIIYLIFSIIFILLTNTYFNFEQSLIYGAADGKTYMQIAEASPNFSLAKEPYHKAQRFIFPYIIGLMSFITNIELISLFRGSCISLLLLNLYFFFKIFKKLNVDKYHQIFLFSLIIFNPYLFRYYVALPTLINDLMFIFSGTLLLFSLIQKNKICLFIAIFLGAASRINVIFFLTALIVGKFIFKKKFHFSLIDILITIIIFYLTHSINNYHANIIGHQNSAYDITARLGIFFTDFSFKDLLIFTFFPVINFFFIILIPFLFKIKFDYKNLKKDPLIIFSFIIVILIVIIAYLPGPIITGKNITRLINLSYPFLLLILLKVFLEKSKINSLKIIITLIFLTVWSLHPTYSNIDIFKPLLEIFKN